MDLFHTVSVVVSLGGSTPKEDSTFCTDCMASFNGFWLLPSFVILLEFKWHVSEIMTDERPHISQYNPHLSSSGNVTPNGRFVGEDEFCNSSLSVSSLDLSWS